MISDPLSSKRSGSLIGLLSQMLACPQHVFCVSDLFSCQRAVLKCLPYASGEGAYHEGTLSKIRSGRAADEKHASCWLAVLESSFMGLAGGIQLTCIVACSRCTACSRMLQMRTWHNVRPPASPHQTHAPQSHIAEMLPALVSDPPCTHLNWWGKSSVTSGASPYAASPFSKHGSKLPSRGGLL